MKKKKLLLLSAIFTVCSVIASMLFNGFRISFVFIDSYVFDGFCYCLWALIVINTLFQFAHLRSVLTKGKPLGKKPLFLVNCVLSAISLILCLIFFLAGPGEALNFLFYVPRETAPYMAAFLAVCFLMAVFPVCSSLCKKIMASVTAFAVVVVSLVAAIPVGGFDFESAPAVFDVGDAYRVVFATNRESVGCVSYTYNGEDYTVWDTTTGRKDSSRVHSVEIPYEHLDNNAYTVGAVRVIEDIAYGGHLGKEISYQVEQFRPCPDDNFDVTLITDNHECRVDWASLGDGAELCIFLGDIANGVYSTDHYIDNLIVPAGEASGGAVPSIYVRGNHDHRGNAVPDMLADLDFDTYYYQIEIGDYCFTVLDTGEDKPDDNYEYAGYNDYASYNAEQAAWASSLEKDEEKYQIVLAHSPTLFAAEDGRDAPIADSLQKLGAEIILCGHEHQTLYVTQDQSETGIQYYICGSGSGRSIFYTTMHVQDGLLSICSVNNLTGDTPVLADIQLHRG